MTLTEFLEREISKDEVDAILLAKWDDIEQDETHALAICEALRRILALHNPCDDWSYGDASTCPELRSIAAIYADRPDFCEEWRA